MIAVPQRPHLTVRQPLVADLFVEAGEPPHGGEDKTVTALVAHPVTHLVHHPLVVAGEQVVELEPRQWRWAGKNSIH